MRILIFLSIYLFSLPIFAQDAYHNNLTQMLENDYSLEVSSFVFNNTEVNINNSFYIFGGATRTTFEVPGNDFSRVLSVSNNTVGDPWAAGLGIRNVNPISQGDIVLLTFWGKRTSVNSDLPIFIERASDYEKEFYQAINLTAEWTQYFIAIEASNNYSPNALTFGFHLGNVAQSFQLGGLTALNLSDQYNLGDISFAISADAYGGSQDNAPWRAEAANRIETLRKADMNITVVDMNGNAIPNATVRVEMQEHDFGFGSAMVMCRFPGNNCFNQTYIQKIKNLDGQGHGFNAAVSENALKWDGWEEGWAGSTGQIVNGVEWLDNQGIDVRGHTLVWPGWDKMPDDILENQNNITYIKNRIDERLESMLLHPVLGELVTEWDVINEVTFVRDLENAFKNTPGYNTGRELYTEIFNKTTELRPNNVNYLNDYALFSGASNINTINRYKEFIQEIIDSGAKLDGIGFQAHIGASPTSILRVKEIYDDFYDSYAKPIKVTEYDIDPSVSPETQARYLNDFLTMTFSHESVEAFIMWGFWDGNHWKDNAPMFDINWNLKPSGEAFNNLVFNEWWTDETKTTNSQGLSVFRPFKGQHKIYVDYNGVTQVIDANLTSDTDLNVVFGVTATQELDATLVEITPNPTRDFIQVTLNEELANVDLEILDITGKVCQSFEQVSTGNRLEIDLSSGVYVVRLRSLDQTGYRKLVVQ